ncbi:hypothetical protein DX116_11010 [Aeromicrobium endophyticum]|uniref:DUF4352 domain-containing protein n=1 Tax=Aeromicrobium endophyticum TaxID=2292704 RepID=A0A371P2Z3_9ACTN|nr:hypothetical protein DX116_11010 [Aeromicrobium endophyticum]
MAASAMAVVLVGCSSSEPKPAPSPTTAEPSKAFDPPPGVSITPGGTRLAVGEPGTVVHQVADSAASAITVTVSAVTRGSMKDFRYFSLDAATKRSSPYYVRATVTNDGPAGLGGAAMPLFAVDSTGTSVPANDIVGTFEPCPVPALPESFLPGASADLCLVYLLPKGRTLTSVSLQTTTPDAAISWTP